MSKTDGTRPYALQVSDRTGRRPGQVRHNHWQRITQITQVDITWGDLVEKFSKDYFGKDWTLRSAVIPGEELVYAAYFGHLRRTRYAEVLEATPQLASTLNYLRKRINNYLTERTLPDPGNEFTSESVVGRRKSQTTKTVPAPCDYHPDNSVYNHKLPGHSWTSPNHKRCVWEVTDNAIGGVGGCSCSSCGYGKSRRSKYHRAGRRQMNIALNNARYGFPLDDARLGRKRHM